MILQMQRGRAYPFALSLLFTLFCFFAPHIETTQAQTIAPCLLDGGRIDSDTYFSAHLNETMRYSVYLPPCYDPSETYPVIYLLHGSNSTDEHWLILGLPEVLDRGIAGGAFPPVVVAMPYGGWIANENRFIGNATWSNIFLTEFMPQIDSRYAVRVDRAGRAIGGISRGGFWAFNIALRFPDQFAAVGGHSAFFDPGHFPAEHNPLNLAQSAPDVDSLRIWLDRGVNDYAFFGLDLMGGHLSSRGIDHTYTIYPEGQHNDAYWSANLRDYIAFYAAEWDTPEADLLEVRHDFDLSGMVDLYVPAVAFPAIQVNIDSFQLSRVYAGGLDFDLVLSESVHAELIAHGVPVNVSTAIVPDASLLDVLWTNRDVYTLIPFTSLSPRLRPLNIDGLHLLDAEWRGYPFVFTGENFDPARMTRILFSGVTALGRTTREVIEQNGVQWAASGIRDVVVRPDFFHISNEVSFAPRCPLSDEPVFGGLCAVDDHFALLYLLGVDIVELSGNHNNDYGHNAYLRTLEMYEAAGMATVAGGRNTDEAREPLIIEHGGSSVALVSCNWNGPDFALATDDTPGATFCVLSWLREIIPALQAEHDLVIVTLQYAEYDLYYPIPRQINHFREVAEMGADVVLGTQAHQPQIFEFHPTPDGREVFIHHGMGNLFFDQTSWEHTRFFMDEVLIYDGRLLGVTLHTGVIEDRGRPRMMTSAETVEFLTLMFSESGF